MLCRKISLDGSNVPQYRLEAFVDVEKEYRYFILARNGPGFDSKWGYKFTAATKVVVTPDAGGLDLSEPVNQFQCDWNEALQFEAGVATFHLDRVGSCMNKKWSSHAFPIKDSYYAMAKITASEALRDGASVADADHEDVAKPATAGRVLAMRRKVVNLLCKIEHKQGKDGPMMTVFPMPRPCCRPLSTSEGQRPVNPLKVAQLKQLILSNPHITPLTMQMIALDRDLPPQAAFKAYQSVCKEYSRDSKGQKSSSLPMAFGISGGQHYFLGMEDALAAEPQLVHSPKAKHFSTELYALGYLTSLDKHFQEMQTADQARMEVGADGYSVYIFNDEQKAEATRRQLLPKTLWEALTPEERCLIPSAKDAVLMLVTEHNDVVQLGSNSTFQQKVVLLRDRAMELKLGPDAANNTCAGVPATELSSLAHRIGCKEKRDLVPYMRIALSPQGSWDRLMTVLEMFKEYKIVGQIKPKQKAKKKKGGKSEGDVNPPQPKCYYRMLSPLWEPDVSEEARLQILEQLIAGTLNIKHVTAKKREQVCKMNIIEGPFFFFSFC